MNKSKPKVILSQLNIPNNGYTVPLASGYLKAMAHKAGLSKTVDIEILNGNLNNVKSDSNIISYIVERQPISVGFSCYVWNMDRTIYIINQIKARIPKVKIICGGSEISSQYKKYMRNKNIDVIVIGEGELIFVELLKNFLFNTPELEKIKGIVFRKKGKIIITPKREQITDVNVIPSPYLLGFIDPREYGRITIETYRGCIGKCTYCNWRRNSHGIRYFSAERIRKEIKLAKEKKVDCEILDTVFNLPKNLLRLSKIIKKVNHDKSMKFAVEGRAEYINKGAINRLSQCNVTHMNIGLQSINQTALSNVNRWFNKKLFIQGLKLLKKAKISFRLDIIIGLPGDTIDSIKKTVRFAERYNKNGDNYFEILHVQPDTKLRKQAKEFNLKYLKKIPYYVLSTNKLSHSELKKLSTLCFDNSRGYSQDNNTNFIPYHPFTKFPFLPEEDYREISKDILKTQEVDNIVSKIVFEIDKGKQTIKQVKNLAINLRQFVTIDSEVFFKCIQVNHNYLLIREFLYQISKANPFSKFCIFIENDDFFEIKILNKLQQAIVHIPNYLEYREKFYADLSNVKTTLQKCNIAILQLFSSRNLHNMKRISKDTQIIWKILISQTTNWKAALLKVLNTPYGSLLINFESNHNNLFFIAEVLKYICGRKEKNKLIFFSDYAVQLFYNEILIKEKSLLDVIKNFRYNSMLIPSKTVYIDRYFNKDVRKHSVTKGILKLIDISNAYKLNAK
ncbi:MAG: radical SAM protein [Candidatus Omnitrophota bacterium]